MDKINKYARPCIVLVDPFSTSSVLAKEFDKRGYDCISLISRIKIPEVFISSYQPNDFLFEIRYENNIEEILSTLKRFPVKVVISCLETSVFLADTIADQLGLPGNSPKTSSLRRDKYKMIEAIRGRGLKAAWQKIFNTTQDAVSWINQKAFPVVIKPLRSAGTDSVFICNSIVQVEEACNTILNHRNKLEEANDEVLVQEFLKGDEYVVDTVTLNGKTVTCNVFSYEKEKANGADFVYRAIRAIDLSSPIAQKLIAYNNEVIKAVGIFQGAGHSEIMITDNEPCLVEIGARLHGGNIPSVVQKCAPWSQIELLIDSCIDHIAFDKKSTSILKLDKNILIHFYISSRKGFVQSVNKKEVISSLRSYLSSIWYCNEGDTIEKTIDLYTCPLKVILANENNSDLIKDRNILLDMEKNGEVFSF